MSGKPPYFPFYVNDFAADGKVEAMTTEMVGAYILLLCKAWLEDPPGTLPNDDKILARWARMEIDRWMNVRTAVLSPFTAGTSGRLYQKRMVQEANKFLSVSKARRKSAQSRWNKNAKEGVDDESDANAVHLHSNCNANGNAKVYDPSGSDSDSDSEISSERNEGPGERGTGAPPLGASEVSEQWCFYYRGTARQHRDRDVMGEFFADLISRGADPKRMIELIRSKSRPKTEPPWQFEERILPKEAAKTASTGITREKIEKAMAEAEARRVKK